MADHSVLGDLLTAVSAVGGAALTGFVTYSLGRWNIRKDLEVELRREKLHAFKKLWAISEPLAKYGRAEPVTPAVLAGLSQNLRKWYFEQGGMFLSDASRNKYFEFQESLQAAIGSHTQGSEGTQVKAQVFESVRAKGSELRSALRTSFSGFPQM